ncbi:MAG: hypothetical protein MUF49_21370 [Oculatellaceae cyanobacterium Prado106]|nr:hypothetical protein [Oculatellaceae cyanobacterium Prado106]
MGQLGGQNSCLGQIRCHLPFLSGDRVLVIDGMNGYVAATPPHIHSSLD